MVLSIIYWKKYIKIAEMARKKLNVFLLSIIIFGDIVIICYIYIPGGI